MNRGSANSPRTTPRLTGRPRGRDEASAGKRGVYLTAMRADSVAGVVVSTLVIGCGEQTQCERTGVCVTIDGDGESVERVPPLVVNASFSPPVADRNAISSSFGPRWK